MRIHQIAAVSLISLLLVLAVGCSKMPAGERVDFLKSFGLPADMPLKDLGVVELRVGTPKRVSVGWGKACTVTATTLTNGSTQFDLLYESTSEVIDGVKIQPYSECSKTSLTPRLLASAIKTKSWICFHPMRPHFVVALQPNLVQ